MVGRFIEDKQLRLISEHANNLETRFLPTTKASERHIAIGLGKEVVAHQLAELGLTNWQPAVEVHLLNRLSQCEVKICRGNLLLIHTNPNMAIELQRATIDNWRIATSVLHQILRGEQFSNKCRLARTITTTQLHSFTLTQIDIHPLK